MVVGTALDTMIVGTTVVYVMSGLLTHLMAVYVKHVPKRVDTMLMCNIEDDMVVGTALYTMIGVL